MRLIAAITLLLAAATSAHAASGIHLSRDSENYLEGKWAVLSGVPVGDPCVGSNQSDDDWETYEFEFLRSGGSFRIADDVDADWRGSVAVGNMSGRSINLQLSELDGSRFKDMVLIPAGQNRMQVRETIGGIDHGPLSKAVAYRCSKPHHEVTSALTDASVNGLTLAYFVEVVDATITDKVCRQPFPQKASRLTFELLGPAQFGVAQDATDVAKNRHWEIIGSKMSQEGAVVLVSKKKSPTDKLTVISVNPHRISVPELKADFVRCPRP